MGADVTFSCNRTGFMPEPATIKCVSSTDGNVDWDNKAEPQCLGKCFCNVHGSKLTVVQWFESYILHCVFGQSPFSGASNT